MDLSLPPDAFLEAVQWNADGLVPAIAQDVLTGKVLMLAWMNAEALRLSIRERRGIYWSRSRQSLWRKGESSGHVQHLQGIYLDCDGDTVLLRVRQEGPACHTGAETCFFREAHGEHWQDCPAPVGSFLEELERIIQQRRQADPAQSYVAKLLQGGRDRVLKKVGEEATEFLLACKNPEPQPVLAEGADLLFHFLVALTERNLQLEQVLAELQRREGVSGIAEKAARQLP